MNVDRYFPFVYRAGQETPDYLVHVRDCPVDPTGGSFILEFVLAEDRSVYATVSSGDSIESITSSVDALSGETFYEFKMRMPLKITYPAAIYYLRAVLTVGGNDINIPADDSMTFEVRA